MTSGLSYKDAGVDIDKNTRLKDTIQKTVRPTFGPEVLSVVGGFGGLFEMNLKKFKKPVLVSSVDGVGTKLQVAQMLNRYDTVGIDIVSHCANDILVCGARPLFFLDYIGAGLVTPEVFQPMLKGLATGCKKVKCALIGGETAEMPGIYKAGDYDLVGCMIGVVEKYRIVDPTKIRRGDVLISIPSSGLHTNGYSLARKIFFELKKFKATDTVPGLKGSIGDVLLQPHREYSTLILPMFERIEIKGLVHITGGGFQENIPRVLPRHKDAVIRVGSWEIPPVFRWMQEAGNVAQAEMFRTFNMGVGMILVVGASAADGALKYLKRKGEDARIIGEVREGSGKVHLE
jgi:phosphoribosylformylglycinamidine cyclo-ligase